jgi:hypothetical protein
MPQFCFELDKIGMSKWDDQKTRKASIPSALMHQTIGHGVNKGTSIYPSSHAYDQMDAASHPIL